MSKASIFISYRIADTLTVADRLAAELQRTFGKEAVFFDHRDVEPADPWDEVIEAAVRDAQSVQAWPQIRIRALRQRPIAGGISSCPSHGRNRIPRERKR